MCVYCRQALTTANTSVSTSISITSTTTTTTTICTIRINSTITITIICTAKAGVPSSILYIELLHLTKRAERSTEAELS